MTITCHVGVLDLAPMYKHANMTCQYLHCLELGLLAKAAELLLGDLV